MNRSLIVICSNAFFTSRANGQQTGIKATKHHVMVGALRGQGNTATHQTPYRSNKSHATGTVAAAADDDDDDDEDAIDRQVIQSEPARPKPRWSNDNRHLDSMADDEGFEDILQ